MTLKTFPTVYNDLIGEVIVTFVTLVRFLRSDIKSLFIYLNLYFQSNQIDAATVKWLDRNLYIGDEIREVYEEVIKTVGTSHLLFDQVCFAFLSHVNEISYIPTQRSPALPTVLSKHPCF